MASITSLREEADDALESVWFVQSIEEIDHTDITLSLRLHIQAELFVQIFYGEYSNSLYFALIENDRRIFGVDRERDQWHLHPFEEPTEHLPLSQGLEPKPLLSFLSQVEQILLDNELI